MKVVAGTAKNMGIAVENFESNEETELSVSE